jgi:hypothetical protein
MATRKVRILFVNCSKLDVDACTYVLLAQNSVQNLFEFEVCHHWVSLDLDKFGSVQRIARIWSRICVFDHRLWGADRAYRMYLAAMDRASAPFLDAEMRTMDLNELWQLVRKHEEKLSHNRQEYGGSHGSLPTIVITETPLSGGFISVTEDNFAIVTVAEWQRIFAPPSALEFLLLSVQRLALRVSFKPVLKAHYPTRACIADFTPYISDFKSAILVGHLCSDCSALLSNMLSEDEMKDLRHLVSHKWLGKLEESGSVASNLKRVYEYDLSRTRGLRPSLVERTTDILWSSEVFRLICSLIGLLLLWAAAKHPILWILEKIHIHY